MRNDRWVFLESGGSKRKQNSDDFARDSGDEEGSGNDRGDLDDVEEVTHAPNIAVPEGSPMLSGILNAVVSAPSHIGQSVMDDAGVLLHREPEEGERSDAKGNEGCASDFSSENLPELFWLEFLKGKTTDHKSDGLTTSVSASVHKDRDECGKNRKDGKSILENGKDH